MKIAVGSRNPVKIEAVREAFAAAFPDEDVEVSGVEVGAMVAIFGAEMVFETPLFSSAVRRRFRLNAPPADPRMKPIAPPDPSPTAAGRLTAKFGALAVPAVAPPPIPPVAPTLFGNERPVGFPVACVNAALPPHCTPSALLKLE